MAQVCPLCKRKFEGEKYSVKSFHTCCKKCYDEYRRDTFIKADPRSRKLNMWNNIVSLITNVFALASVIGIIMLFGSKWKLGLLLLGIGFVAILSSLVFSSWVDDKINERIIEERKDIALKLPFWKEEE